MRILLGMLDQHRMYRKIEEQPQHIPPGIIQEPVFEGINQLKTGQ
jgi:hypothetical protein